MNVAFPTQSPSGLSGEMIGTVRGAYSIGPGPRPGAGQEVVERHAEAVRRSNEDDLGHELRIWVYIRNDKNFDFAQIGVRIIAVILECCLDVKTNS
jgi:hypothetical protein